jgi:hypothetical protein
MRTVGTFKQDPDTGRRSLNAAQKMAASLVAGSVGLALLNRMMSGDDDDGENWYDKVPQHVRERNVVIMKSVFGGPEGEYYSLPLPYGYNVFYNLGDAAEAMINSETRGIGELSTNLTMAMLGSFSPVGVETSDNIGIGALKTITPTILTPFVQLGVNENFYGAPIYPENHGFGIPDPKSSMSRRSTKAHWKAIAEWMNEATGGSRYQSGAIDIQPDAIGHLFDFTTGSAGAFYSRTADAVKRTVVGEEVEVRNQPFLRKLQGSVGTYDDMDSFYQRRDKIGQVKNELSALRGKEAAKFRKENAGMIRMIGPTKYAEKQLKTLRKQLRLAQSGKQTKAKKARAEAIQERMDKIVDNFNKQFMKAQS